MEDFSEKSGKKAVFLGNEAIVRAALEIGVNFVSTYPGTPASEIGNIFSKIAKKNNICFEFSVNEKTALEASIGASFCGLKCFTAMKNFGLNVASDSLIPLLYTGIKGRLVILTADDPGCWSSAQSEQNSRGFSYLARIPTLEPSDPQECYDFTKRAFQISEKFKMPIMIRTTTRVAHQRALVKFGKIDIPKNVFGMFAKEPKKWTTMPPRVLEMKKELLEKIRRIQKFAEKSKINLIENCPPASPCEARRSGRAEKLKIENFKTGIITSGISYLYVQEALKELKIDLPVLKLGFFYPLPEEKIKKFIKPLKKVLIVEELEPYLEKEVEKSAKNVNPKLEIFGKNLLPEIGELNPEIVISAIAEITNLKHKIQNSQYKIPRHLPKLCSNCPYWLVIAGIKKAIKNFSKVIFGGDIGCYMLFSHPLIKMQDYLSCMGSSIGIGHGIKKSTNQKLIAFIGDSTFFHAGIPALINCVFNKSNPLIIILDNRTTAMTGHQPNPGAAQRENSEYQMTKELPGTVKIENIVSGCGVKNLKVINPVNQKEFVKTVKDFLNKKEVSVIIARKTCAILASK